MPRLLPLAIAALLVPLAAGRLLLPGAEAAPRLAPVVTGTTLVTTSTPLAAPAGSRATGPRENGTAVLPSGRYVTPFGPTTLVDLLPTRLLLSRDGSRLYVSSEGMDDSPTPSAYDDHTFERYVSILDPATLQRTARVRDDALHYGLAESPDGRSLYVSEGATGSLGTFARTAGGLQRTGGADLGTPAYPWGLALSPDGKTAYVGGFSNDTLSVVDTASRARIAQLATGQYPTDVQLSPDGTTLYVLNSGLYNQDADDSPATPITGQVPLTTPPLTLAGYNGAGQSSMWIVDVRNRESPTVTAKIRVGKDLDGSTVVGGSVPSHVAPSPDGRLVAVTASNNDLLELREAATGALVRSVDLRAIADGPTGTQPGALAWAPDGRTLYVAEAGRDAVAILDPATGAVRGRVPTAWYPTALALSPDGRHLYVASGKGFGAGRNDVGPAHGADKLGTDTSYIVNRLKGTVQDVDLSAASCRLGELTALVQRNNGLLAASGADPSGGVVPVRYGQPSSAQIKHVVYIVKENRTYDQVFGDLTGTERAQRVAPYSGKVTPNQHAIAREYGISDNFSSVAQTSYDGHYIVDTGQSNRYATLMAPLSYANKLPHDRFVTSPENLPEGGFLWNNLARAGISFKVYGEATYLVGLAPTALNAANSPTNPLPPALYALGGTGGSFSPTYPSQVTQETPVTSGDDETRADDFLQDLQTFSATGQAPSLLQLILPDDHTDGARPGQPTPQTYIGENDHALGRIVEGLSKSPFWDSTAVFVVEDDTQDGQDHVDASRTFTLVAGGQVKKGHVSHTHTSQLSVLKTINLLLGAPPTSLDELTSTSLADFFTSTTRADGYTTRPNLVGSQVNPPYPAKGDTSAAARAARLMERIPAGVDRGGPLLQQALILQNQAAVEAGSSQVPPQPDIVEQVLDRSAPAAAPAPTVCAAAAPTGAPVAGPGVAGAGAAGGDATGGGTSGPATATAGRSLPATGSAASLAPLALLLVVGAASIRRRRTA